MGKNDAKRGLIRSARGRVAVVFFAFAFGLWTARTLGESGWAGAIPSAVWFSAVALAAAGVAAFRGRVAAACGLVACVCLGGGWWTFRISEADPADLAARWSELVAGRESTPVTVEGVVVDRPQKAVSETGPLSKFVFGAERWRFVLEARAIEGESGIERWGEGARVWVSVRGSTAPTCEAGDWVRISGMARGIEGPRNPGESDLRLLARERGWAGSLSTSDASLVIPIAGVAESVWESAERGWWRSRAWLRDRAERAVAAALGEQATEAERALVRGLVLGVSDPAEGELFASWARLGLAHVLSISGFHLAVLAGLTLFMLRLTGDRGWLEPALVGAAVVAYAAILPPDSPILRSAAMVVALLAGEAIGRRYDRLALLGWIALGLLVWRPLDLWSLGFQMSVGLTALLMWSVDAFRDQMFGEEVRSDVPRVDGARDILLRWVKSAIAGGLSCGLVGAPLVLFRTGVFSPLSLAATLIVTPLVVAVLWSAYVSLLVGMVWTPLAGAAGPVVRWGAGAAIASADWLSRLPAAWSTTPALGAGGWGAAWTIAATVVMLWLVRGAGWRRARWWGALALVCVGASALWWRGGLSRDVVLRVDMLSVGDGTCIAVRSGNEAVLWDCGSLASGGEGGARRLTASLRALGVWNTPTVFITHPDIDHFGLLPGVAETLGVRRVIVPRRFLEQAAESPESAAGVMLDWVLARGIEVRPMASGEMIGIGATKWTILSPPPAASWELDNEHSLVARVEALTERGPRRVLLTGDVQSLAIAALREKPDEIAPVQIVEAPHHGSASSASVEWLRELGPAVVHQSTGPRRAGDERWALVRSAAVWWTTSDEGASWSEVLRDGSIRTGALRRRGSVTVEP